MKRAHSGTLLEELPEKKMKTTTTTSSIEECLKYNKWRVHSQHNPIWNLPASKLSNISESQLDAEKFSFRNTLNVDSFTVSLTPKEQQIFSFLLETNAKYNLNTTLRVAGGWVRNKVLSIGAEDIDIALDNMMGIDFAQKVHELQKEKGMASHSIGLIRANPEQSKHLESATTHVFEEAIDFVNLRSEKYADDSRIPSHMALGTPLEDAQRRDLTVNSLYYNLNTGKVEDYTGMGLSDLKQGIVRTPLDPHQTFLDDPLRVLRCIRFASGYNFIVTDAVFEAALDPKIKKALAEKVTRERVGIELYKMMKGPDPVGSFALIAEMNLKDVVFTVSSAPKQKKKGMAREYINPQPIKWTDAQWNNALFRARSVCRLAKSFGIQGDEKISTLLASILSNTAMIQNLNLEDLLNFAENFVGCALKLPAKLADDTAKILYYSQKIHALFLKICPQHDNLSTSTSIYYKAIKETDRLALCLWLREANQLYKHALLVAQVLQTTGTEFTSCASSVYGADDSTRVEAFIQALKQAEMESVIAMKPLLNGQEISKLLKVEPGKIIGQVINSLIEWQILNFETMKKDEAQEFVLQKYKQ